jgi:predicted ABC-type ATPase
VNIYIIAGPPGIGKSTSSFKYIPENIEIIDHDLAGYQYKKQGFADYKELGMMAGNQQIRSNLIHNEDFALEMNLGFQSHYDYLRSIAQFDQNNKIHLILFFTSDLDLCLFRANIRHKKGGHLVSTEIIREMYEQTIPLLKQHLKLFSSISFLDVTNDNITKVTSDSLPDWVKNSGMEVYV